MIEDEGGIEALTMRNLAEHLGVEAMSLYYHVANKEALLDGVVEALMHEIAEETGGFAVPDDHENWQTNMRERILQARKVMLRHPWAPGVFETRTTMSPSVIMYFEALLGIMKEGGFSYDLAHHSMHAIGSRALGFSQELFTPANQQEEEESEEMFNAIADQLPYLAGMLMEIVHDDPENLGWCDDQTEFTFALDLMLDGLETKRLAEKA